MFVSSICKILRDIFTIWNNKNNFVQNFRQIAKHCSVFYNNDIIIVIAVHVTPSSFNPYGHPVKTISRKITSADILGHLVLDTIDCSRVIYDESLCDKSDKLLYKQAGVRSWKMLTKSFHMVSIDRLIDGNKVTMAVFNAVKGGYLATVDDPVYCVDLNPSEIGNTLLSIMDKYVPISAKIIQ
ncbi:MAG: hypothetical protein LBP59_17225 [Planctomycetaceae bacterium]|jgi:hypothetical protein|nr:hypothetical protein [Planctomycetaceae bacterium]